MMYSHPFLTGALIGLGYLLVAAIVAGLTTRLTDAAIDDAMVTGFFWPLSVPVAALFQIYSWIAGEEKR